MTDRLIVDISGLYAASKNLSYRAEIKTIFETYIRFLQDAGLTTRTFLQPEDDLPSDVRIRRSDLTDEGFEFVKRVQNNWLMSKDRGRPLTDISLLEKELKELRGE
jgi:hypothetical protein